MEIMPLMWTMKKFITEDLISCGKPFTDLYQIQISKKFVKENAFWLEDYSLYMAVKNSQDGASWSEWDSELKRRNPE